MSQLPGGPIVGITMDLVTSFSERQPRKTGTGQRSLWFQGLQFIHPV